jgi:hypothetical protein
MFFDDQVCQRVKSCYPKNQKSAEKLVESIIQSFIKKLKTDLQKAPMTYEYCRTCTKKVINLWNSAARKLIKEGYPLLKEGGLNAYLKYTLPEGFKHFAE